jgi:hypothetical protein
MHRTRSIFAALVAASLSLSLTLPVWANPLRLPPASAVEGYIARLLINEVTFPGEWGYCSEEDTKAAMEQMLLVLDGRLRRVPPPYLQRHIAATSTDNMFDIITAGGVRGQFDGFYRDASGRPTAVPRVEKRIVRLLQIANRGEPGRFFRLLTHASDLATNYVVNDIIVDDRHAAITKAQGATATGGSFSWMTDKERFHPGGNFLRIEDHRQGSLGGNRFFTLRREPR